MAIFRNRQTRSKTGVAATIVGGSISEVRPVPDPADAGLKIFLVEHPPCPGKRVAQFGFKFPRPAGVLRRGASSHGYGCTRPFISPAHIHHNQHPNIEVLTTTRVIGVEGQAGNFTVSLRAVMRAVMRDTDVGRCIDRGCTPPGERKKLRECCTSSNNITRYSLLVTHTKPI
jgi:heterodisulfide reductase subunit A